MPIPPMQRARSDEDAHVVEQIRGIVGNLCRTLAKLPVHHQLGEAIN
jgi:hypothetical protein